MFDVPVTTLESANALVPQLTDLVGEQMGRRVMIDLKISVLSSLLGHTPDSLEPVEDDSSEVAGLRAEARDLVQAYRDGWRQVEQLGAVVKDPQRGLVDFYGCVDGHLVWLCWQYGEAEVSHYHGIAEGLDQRKVIERAAKQRLLN
jgi:hypothetical protein